MTTCSTSCGLWNILSAIPELILEEKLETYFQIRPLNRMKDI